MDWQLTIALAAVAWAGAYLGWRAWRLRRPGCGGSCGCSKTAPVAKTQVTLIPPEQLGMRRRGEGRS